MNIKTMTRQQLKDALRGYRDQGLTNIKLTVSNDAMREELNKIQSTQNSASQPSKPASQPIKHSQPSRPLAVVRDFRTGKKLYTVATRKVRAIPQFLAEIYESFKTFTTCLRESLSHGTLINA